MARVLITGTPGRLAPVANRLLADGHVVRCAVPGGEPVCDGAESVDATPDLPGEIVMALQGVAVVAWLLGDEPWCDPDLHGGKLETMLLGVVDTGVRGFVYERPVGYDAAAEAQLSHAHDTWHIPCAVVDGGEGGALAEQVSAAVAEIFGI